jgi:hypothetical protein
MRRASSLGAHYRPPRPTPLAGSGPLPPRRSESAQGRAILTATMLPSTRARTTLGQWVLVGVLLLVLVFAPALVAHSVTASREPVHFLTRPWHGWAFTGSVLRESVRAEAAAPGEALGLARQRWDGEGSTPLATRVELLYLPGSTSYRLGASAGGSRVAPDGPLAWLVLGRADDTARERELGAIDFTTGGLLPDESAPEAAPRQPAPTSPRATGKDTA